MKLLADNTIVPVLMFHSVGLQDHRWIWNTLSEPKEVFEAKLTALRRAGFTAVDWRELYGYMAGDITLPPKSVMLTFDDGYLDNWVYVYPLLKKYGLKGTIFVNPDFIDPGASCRPNLDDVWSGKVRESDLETSGFLNWPELLTMQESGVIDIQSHALTHTWHFSGPAIVDLHFHRDIDLYPWLAWNNRPERKPFYLTEDQQSFVCSGSPIFEHDKALLVRRFLPDALAVQELTEFVEKSGGGAFVAIPGWKNEISQWLRKRFGTPQFPGVYESEEERVERLRLELSQSRKILEDGLGKPVEFICWPGGGNNQQVRQIAREVGYKAWTLGSQDQSDKRNLPGSVASNVKRIGTQNRVSVRGRVGGYGGARYQMMRIRQHQGSLVSAILLRTYKLMIAGKQRLMRRW